mmetsp:Transcript_120560/g.213249  ORF Transcript_120560/g.213249 Transcript_120560/m.213249 type:complete len:724 (+) Transcript_120560:62-2233(+)
MAACEGLGDAATVQTAASPASAAAGQASPCIFLVDASKLFTMSASQVGQLWSPPSHHLSTNDQLLECYRQIRDRRPDARILTFLEGSGYSNLCSEWSASGAQSADVPTLQCVPFGCKVSAFLVEFADRKAAEGCEVAAVSNEVEVVMASLRTPNVSWRHLGFMFIDSEFILPGLSHAPVATALPAGHAGTRPPRPAAAVPPVRRTIFKARSGSLRAGSSLGSSPGRQLLRCGSRSSQAPTPARPGPEGQARSLGSQQRVNAAPFREEEEEEERRAGASEDGDQDTLRDDDLDGVALDMDIVEAMNCGGEEFADTFVEARSRSGLGASLGSGEAFADTLMDTRRSLPRGVSGAGEAFADTQVDAHASLWRGAGQGGDGVAYADTLVVEDRQPTSLSGNADLYADTQVDAEMGVPCSAAPDHQSPHASLTPAAEEGQGAEARAAPNEPQGTSSADAAAGMCIARGCSRQASTVTLEADKPSDPKGDKGDVEGDPDVIMLVEDNEGIGAGAARSPAGADLARVKHEPCSQPTAETAVAEAGGAPEVAQQMPPSNADEVAVEFGARTNSQAAALPDAAPLEPDGEHASSQPVPLEPAGTSARKLNLSPEMLIGAWVRDGGRTHEVVRLPGEASDGAAQLEFQPTDGERSRRMPILRSGDTWNLNGFLLDITTSSPKLLRWEKQPGGQVRNWWRPSSAVPAGRIEDGGPEGTPGKNMAASAALVPDAN